MGEKRETEEVIDKTTIKEDVLSKSVVDQLNFPVKSINSIVEGFNLNLMENNSLLSNQTKIESLLNLKSPLKSLEIKSLKSFKTSLIDHKFTDLSVLDSMSADILKPIELGKHITDLSEVTKSSLQLQNYNLNPIKDSLLLQTSVATTSLNGVFEEKNSAKINSLTNSVGLSLNAIPNNISYISEILDKQIFRLPELRISYGLFTDEEIKEAINIIEKENIKKETEIDETKGKPFKKFPIRIKGAVLFIYFLIEIMANFITVWGVAEEKVVSIQKNYFINIENAVFQSEREGIKWLNDELKKDSFEQIERNFRIVIKSDLIVRTERRKDSRIAGTLDTGYVVQIIEKKRNWTYVLYSDPSEGVVIEGWTNTKYLKKIIK